MNVKGIGLSPPALRRRLGLSRPDGDATLRLAATFSLLMLVGACASTEPPSAAPTQVSVANDATQGRYKIGKPYQIKGVWYYPQVNYEYAETGVASWYGPGFDGQPTANGELYDMNEMTAAHKTLPLPSIVRVTNLSNGRSVKLRVNDRGPFVGDRVIDVSRRAAQLLGFYGAGTTLVRVEVDAEESKRLAAALTGSGEAVAVGTTALPPTVYAPPATDRTAPGPVENTEPVVLASLEQPPSAGATEPPAIGETLAPVVAVPSQQTTTPAPGPARFVQAGAFADPDNAHRARDKLTRVGPVDMRPMTVAGQRVLRVRVGPLASDQEAQRVLAATVQAGFPGSRLVVE